MHSGENIREQRWKRIKRSDSIGKGCRFVVGMDAVYDCRMTEVSELGMSKHSSPQEAAGETLCGSTTFNVGSLRSFLNTIRNYRMYGYSGRMKSRELAARAVCKTEPDIRAQPEPCACDGKEESNVISQSYTM